MLSGSRSGATWMMLGAGLLLGLGLGVAYFLGFPNPAAPAADANGQGLPDLKPAPAVGSLAPDFALRDLDGRTIRLSDLRGQVVLVNFWATWCAPCRVEMPAIQDRFEAYGEDGFVVLAVDFDEPEGVVAAFRDELGLTFAILLDPGAKVQQLYRIRGYPSSFFVDRQGRIRVLHIGVMTENQLDGYLGQVGIGS